MENKLFTFIVCLIIGVSSYYAGFMIGEYIGHADGYEDSQREFYYNNSYAWKNFVIDGDNVDFYIDGEQFISFNNTISFWIQVVGEDTIIQEESKPLDDWYYWERKSDDVKEVDDE